MKQDSQQLNQNHDTEQSMPGAQPVDESPTPSAGLSNTGFATILAALVVVALGGLIFWYLRSRADEDSTVQTPTPTVTGTSVTPASTATGTPTSTPPASPTPDPTADWQTYTNEEYGYSIMYPKDWFERDESSATSYIHQKGFSYQPTPPDTILITDNVNVTIYDSIQDNSTANAYWSSLYEYFSTMEQLQLNQPTDLQSSLRFRGVTAEKVHESRNEYGGMRLIMIPSKDAITHTYRSEVMYYYKDGLLFRILTNITPSEENYYNPAIKIMESFRFIN